jgi:excisionase family DNA binding protein
LGIVGWEEIQMSFMDVKEAAELLEVSVATVYALCNERKLGHVRIGAARGVIRIREKDLDEYIERATVLPDNEIPVVPKTPLPKPKREES